MPKIKKPEFLSSNEIADLLGISRQAVSYTARRQKWQFLPWRGPGFSKIYLFQSLPEVTQARLLNILPAYQRLLANVREGERQDTNDCTDLVTAFKYKSGKSKVRAYYRHKIMLEFIALVDADLPVGKAIKMVSQKAGINPANIRNWYYGTKRKPGLRTIYRDQWLYALADRKTGHKKTYAYLSDSSEPDNQIGNGE